MTPVTPETSSLIEYMAEHWERFVGGLLVIVGLIYRTGSEHQRYNQLHNKVKCLENDCDERMAVIAAMNSNLHLIMGKLEIQPVEVGEHRRRDDH
jgi:hypothetical protein